MSHGRQVPLSLLAVVLTMAGGTGCAAARAGLQVQDAMAAKQAAAEAGAEDAAPYEFTMASRYLEKAWEEIGTGQY